MHEKAQHVEPTLGPTLEPTLATFPALLPRYFAATRPAFLSVTLVACLLGLASAATHGPLRPLSAWLTVLFALVAHAGANVINDYYDALSGCDAANTARVFPFTGGSRFIQNGVIRQRQIGLFGHALLVSVIPAGLWLAAQSAPGLFGIGLAGLFIGWAYSAPPCKLQARGLGEFGVTLGWLLVVVGSDFVQRAAFAFAPVAAGLGMALLIANVLYINQFPDVMADAQAGKRTLVVRLGPARARYGYALIALFAYAWTLAMILAQQLPVLAAAALLPALASLFAAREVWRHAAHPARLARAIKLTILAACLHGVLLAGALLAAEKL